MRYDELGKEIRSEWIPVSYGVLQSSILGPLLFLLYVNDLTDIIPGVMSADNTTMVTRVKNNEKLTETLQKNLKIFDWFLYHNLQLNIKKSLYNLKKQHKTNINHYI